MSSDRPPLDYKPPTHRPPDLATSIAWPCAFIGVILGLVFAIAAGNLWLKSLANKTTGVDRPYFQENARKFGVCAAVVLVPSVWFLTIGKNRHRNDRERAGEA